MRGANLIAVMLTVCVALLACKKDKEKGKEEASASAAAPAAAPPAKYASGDVLKYLPKNCAEGRVFLNLAKLLGPNRADLEKLQKSLLAGTDPDTKKAEKTLKVLKDAGFEVIYTGLHQSVEMIVQSAVQEDVDVIGLSIMSGAHLPICRKLLGLLREKDSVAARALHHLGIDLELARRKIAQLQGRPQSP